MIPMLSQMRPHRGAERPVYALSYLRVQSDEDRPPMQRPRVAMLLPVELFERLEVTE